MNTCDDCSLTWDRQSNVKDIVLCPLHAAAPALLSALEGQGREASTGTWHLWTCSVKPCLTECREARIAIKAASGKMPSKGG